LRIKVEQHTVAIAALVLETAGITAFGGELPFTLTSDRQQAQNKLR